MHRRRKGHGWPVAPEHAEPINCKEGGTGGTLDFWDKVLPMAEEMTRLREQMNAFRTEARQRKLRKLEERE